MPAAVAAAPAVAEIEVTDAGAYVRVHWTAAGSLPVGDVKFKFRDTVPFVPAVPDDRLKESVCPNRTCVNSRKKTPEISAGRPLAIYFVIYPFSGG